MTPPVLCYHRIGGPLELGVTRVPVRTFRRQMQALAKAGWRTLTLEQFGNSAFRIPHSAFLLSFDDGYAELADFAYPVLADLGFTAATFLITDYVGGTNAWDVQYTRRPLHHLDWPEIERWKARGFDFGSHGRTHARLTWADDHALADELAGSRDTLMTRLGADAGRALAYPFGAVNARIAAAARRAGYVLGFGGVRGVAGDPLRIPRVPVYVWDAGAVPFGLRSDAVGVAGRMMAHLANRCAVGTSVMKGVRSRVSGVGSSREIP